MTIATYGLTGISPAFDRMVNDTVPGMAHFAGTGPKGKCCGDCLELVTRTGAKGYGCQRYRDMTGNWLNDEIPRRTKACKYFVQRELAYAKRPRPEAGPIA